MAILAAGVGFAIRNGINAAWSQEFGFTNLQKGLIGGAGFSGFCFGIIIGGVIVDRIGYGKLIISAFLFHVLSAVVTLMPNGGMEQQTAFLLLFTGTFIFSLANGTLEAVANPLVATLFPNNRTHYLNILHASWPLGMILGALITLAVGNQWSWKAQLGLYLLPTVIYGFMFMGQKFPRSDASASGLSLGEMMKEVGILGASVAGFLLYLFTRDAVGENILAGLTNSDFFTGDSWNYISMAVGAGFVLWVAVITKFAIGHWLLFVLFIAHAILGSLELGTDSWIENINGTILTPELGKILFIFACAIMFGLRFCSHWIEDKLKLSPIAILFSCSLFAIAGLYLAAGATGVTAAFGAMFIYSIGKTFFWPTMLAVVGDRFPRTGAVAMSIMGGIGMLSVGQLGGPGLGYAKDRFTAEHMEESGYGEVLQANKAEKPSSWMGFAEVTALDGKKLEEAKHLKKEDRTAEQQAMVESEIAGSRKTLRHDAILPIGMAVIYLLLLIYFKATGGYKALRITPEEASGGVKGPAGF
ncbi:MFS transporter [Luteolibacter flavescens]|nr:MFS transporter [Luteolibacter flavescens]